MAISLGSVYVELKANTAQFIGGMSKAATNSKAFLRDLQGAFGKVGDMFAALGPAGQKVAGVLDAIGSSAKGAFSGLRQSDALLGAFAGLTAGAAGLGATLFGLAEHASEVGAKIYEASEKTGISAEQMSGLMALTKETGGDFDSLTTSLSRAGVNLQKAIIEPGGAAGKVLSAVMGSAKALGAEGLKPMGDRLQDVLKHVFTFSDAGQRNVALSALLGKGWMQNVEALKLLAEQGYAPAEKEAARLGLFFTGDAARQAKQFQIMVTDLKLELQSLGLSIGKYVMPAFQAWDQGLKGMIPRLESYWYRVAAIGKAIAGDLGGASLAWQKANDKAKESDQIQTDFLIHLQNLTADGAKGTEDLGNAFDKQGKHVRSLAADFAELHGEMVKTNELTLAALGLWRAPGAGVSRGVHAGMVPVSTSGLPAQGPGPERVSGESPFSNPALMAAGFTPTPWISGAAGASGGSMAPHLNVLRREFQDFFKQLGSDSGTEAQKMFAGMHAALDGVADQLARLAVTGRANFRQLFSGIAEELIKSNLESLFAKIGGSLSGSGGAAGGGGVLGGLLASVFGGFKAAGGDVSPGRAYVVGEQHPEFFVPNVPGSIAKSLSVGGNQTTVNMHVHGVSDADSFRRSSSQLMGDLHRHMALAHSRNG